MKLIDITPKSIKSESCGIGACPAIFKTDRDTYVIVGKNLPPEETRELLKNKVGPDESVIELPKRFLEVLLK